MAYIANGYKNYSRFYRDHDTFDYMGNELLFRLANGKARAAEPRIDVWCCGCAGGEEPYTLRMLWEHDLAPHFPSLRLNLLATDVCPSAVATARQGRYPAAAIWEMPIDWLDTYFTPQPTDAAAAAGSPPQPSPPAASPGPGAGDAPPTANPPAKGGPRDAKKGKAEAGTMFTVAPPIVQATEFQVQDAEQEVPAQEFDVILARYSVFLYCSNATCWTILQQMVAKCLRPGGYLVIGGKDNLPAQWKTLPLDECTGGAQFGHGVHAYRKRGGDAPPGPAPAQVPPACPPDAPDPPAPGPVACTCSAGDEGACRGTCAYQTLDEYLIQGLHQLARYTQNRRRLVYHFNDAAGLFDDEDANKMSAEEISQFVNRMQTSATQLQSKLAQMRLDMVQQEFAEMTKFNRDPLSAVEVQQHLDRMQHYQVRAQERLERLTQTLGVEDGGGKKKKKKMTKKRMKKFLKRMATAAAAAEEKRKRLEEELQAAEAAAEPQGARKRSVPAVPVVAPLRVVEDGGPEADGQSDEEEEEDPDEEEEEEDGETADPVAIRTTERPGL